MATNTSDLGMEQRSPKRLRTPAHPYEPPENGGYLQKEEQRMLAQALANSKKDQGREPLTNIPFGPTFHPTVEDFSADPLLYFEKIRPVAEKYGICKIVPPKGWKPPFALDVDCPKKFQTKDQSIHRLQEGISFGDGADYTVKEYQKYASNWSKKWKNKHYPAPTKPKEAENKVPKLDPVESVPSGSQAPTSSFEGSLGGGNSGICSSKTGEGDTNPPIQGSDKQVEAKESQLPVAPTSSSASSSEHASGYTKEGNKTGEDTKKQETQLSTPSPLLSTDGIYEQSGEKGKAGEGSVEKPKMTPENLERDYWDIVETQRQDIDVDYGNDIDTSAWGSGFPTSRRGRSVTSHNFQDKAPDDGDLPEPEFGTDDYYRETFWNLNNIPNSKNSVLRHLKVGINGINVPWLYFGSLFSTFCWHNEDNYMYSINYHHTGAPKQWYGVPGTKADADGVERVFKSYLSLKMRDVPDLLHHITTSFSPRLLDREGVRVCKLLQCAGEFIVTFPRAFHGGFSMGPNCGEAVNFALHDWIPHAVDANERYRTFGRPSVFSHDRLVYTMAHHINELRTKDICKALSNELRRLMEEELLLRDKLLRAGVRDVSKDVDLPPNRLDQLDEESADYDDKRLCHSCKHICFFSAVCCECSDSKVSCLRHSHYMCRCAISRKYMLIWTKKSEMKEAIARVEKRGEELGTEKPAVQASASSPDNVELEDAPGSDQDRLFHSSHEVSIQPICQIEVPELVSSDTSICSSKSGLK